MTLLLAGVSADGVFALPAPEELVPNTVARVSEAPVEAATITLAELRHALVLAAAARGKPVPKEGEDGYGRFERKAVDSLLEMIWIRGEAAEMGIVVTRRQVARELAVIKRQAFESEAEYRRFLRESRLTRRDVNERVELQLLALRMQRRLQRRIEREARNPDEEQRALREFVAEFTERWRARTVCAPEYATERCSNGPPPTGKS